MVTKHAPEEKRDYDIHILYLEDEDDDYDEFRGAIEESLRGVARATIGRAWRVGDVKRYLDSHDDVDVFLVDWLIEEDGRVEKPHTAVREAARRRKIAIVGLTKTTAREDTEDFRECGGHLLLPPKDEVRGWQEADWREHLQVALDSVGKSIYRLARTGSRKSVKLRAEVDTVGEGNLAGFIWMILPELTPTEFTPHYVTPGHSGASVIRVDVKTIDQMDEQILLLKISPDGKKLKEELENGDSSHRSAPLPDIYARYRSMPEPKRLGDWYAIAIDFMVGARTLHDWLVAPPEDEETPGSTADEVQGLPSPQKVRDFVRTLFLHHLKPSDYNRRRLEPDMSPYDRLELEDRQCSRILVAISDLEQPLRRLRPAVGIERAVRLLEEDLVGSRSLRALKEGVSICYCHGDLHSRNIMLNRAQEPRLIDAAKRGRHHWATDVARLCADLWVNAWDRDEAHFWGRESEPFFGNVDRWRDEFLAWLTTSEPRAAAYEGVHPVMAALLSLREILCPTRRDGASLFEDRFNEWEFRLALLMELLLHCSYEGVPAPKRCMSLAAADSLIGLLDSEFPETGA